jgi:hypothetical protein
MDYMHKMDSVCIPPEKTGVPFPVMMGLGTLAAGTTGGYFLGREHQSVINLNHFENLMNQRLKLNASNLRKQLLSQIKTVYDNMNEYQKDSDNLQILNKQWHERLYISINLIFESLADPGYVKKDTIQKWKDEYKRLYPTDTEE